MTLCWVILSIAILKSTTEKLFLYLFRVVDKSSHSFTNRRLFKMEISTFKSDFVYRSSVQFRSYIFNFYHVFCSFGYYTFLIHFKFVPVEDGYEIYTNKVRKASETIRGICTLFPVHTIIHLPIQTVGFMFRDTPFCSHIGTRKFAEEILSAQDCR